MFDIEKLESFHRSEVGTENPLWKEGATLVNCIVHRYPDRVLFHITNLCPVYCRHCSRKVHVEVGPIVTAKSLLDQGIDYIASNQQIRDVLLSGGDPLSLVDSKIEYVIKRLRAILHIQIIRIGSRFPVLLPQRITVELCDMLKK